jgi:hypothetical protein
MRTTNNYYINPHTGKALTQNQYNNAPYGTTRTHCLVQATSKKAAEDIYKSDPRVQSILKKIAVEKAHLRLVMYISAIRALPNI